MHPCIPASESGPRPRASQIQLASLNYDRAHLKHNWPRHARIMGAQTCVETSRPVPVSQQPRPKRELDRRKCPNSNTLKIPALVLYVLTEIASPPPGPSMTRPERGDAAPWHDTKDYALYMICDKDYLDAAPPNGSYDATSTTPAAFVAALAL